MEAMALESLVASVWRLDGFLAVTRHPVEVLRGYSDIDVLGVRADGAVRLGECKARGQPRRINIDDGSGWSGWWDASLENCARVWVDAPAFLPAIRDVTAFEYHLVGNVWFSDDDSLRAAEKRLTGKLRKTLPQRLRRRARAFVRPSADLVLEAMRAVRAEIVDDGWGKRYGDPLLDAIRELVRYAHPQPAGAGRGLGPAVSASLRKRLNQALFDD